MDVHKVADNCISGSYISIAGLITSHEPTLPTYYSTYTHISRDIYANAC